MTFDYEEILLFLKKDYEDLVNTYIKDLVNTNIIFANSGYNIGWLHPEHPEIASRAVR